MSNLSHFLLRRLTSKHQKLSSRFTKGIENGSFQKLSRRKRSNAVERLKKVEQQIKGLSQKLHVPFSLKFKHWALALALGIVVITASGQDKKPEIKKTLRQKLAAKKSNFNARNEAIPDFTPIFQLGAAYPENIHSADFDSDGDQDVMYVPYIGGPFILENTGGLNFTESDVLFDDVIISSNVGDFDGDGDPDLLYVSFPTYESFVALNNGDATFSVEAVTLSASCTEGQVGDLDGDGDDDLLLFDYCGDDSPVDPYSSSGFSVWVNDNFNFTPSAELIVGGVGQSRPLGLADLDGDGDLDIPVLQRTLATNSGAPYYNYIPGTSSFTALLNDGTGNFTEAGFDIDPNPGNTSGFARVGDFDGDSDIDILWSEDQNYIISNNGSGEFTPLAGVLIPSFLNGYSNNNDLTLDLNGDNIADIINEGFSSDSTVLWEGDGLGGFTYQTKFVGESKGSDLDGDGDVDLLNFNGNLEIRENQGAFNFVAQPDPLVLASSTYVIKTLDADGDGDVDILQAGGSKSNRLWLNDGTGEAFEIAQTFDYGSDVDEIELSDLDLDGDTDFVVTVRRDTLIGYNFFQYKTLSFLSNEGGNFTSATDVEVNSSKSFRLGDIDGDGDDDIVVFGSGNYADYYLKTILNNGSFNFTQADSIGVPRTRFFQFGDLDGDTDLDIITAAEVYGARVLLNNGTGAFTEVGNFAPAGSTFSISSINIADFDGDGDLDFFANNTYEYATSSYIFLNDGAASFTESGDGINAGYVYRSTIGDLDNDGDIDIITGGYLSNPRTWENNGDGSFTEATPINLLADEYAIPAVADLDNDGDLDLAFGGVYSPNLIFLNNLIEAAPLEADSLALVAFYEEAGGVDWTDNTNWLEDGTTLNDWFGVTANEEDVTELVLPDNNIIGVIPPKFNDLTGLVTVDLSNNAINEIQTDLSGLTQLTSLDLSNNELDFADFEQLADRSSLVVGEQTTDDQPVNERIPAGEAITFEFVVDGNNNEYQWFKDGEVLTDSTRSELVIASIGRETQGDYFCEATNTLIPDLVLTSEIKSVIATAEINGRLLISETDPATAGAMQLLEIIPDEGYDTTAVVSINNLGEYAFSDIQLADYILVGFADTVAHPNALPTYYIQTPFWEDADTLRLEGNVGIDIVSEFYTNPNDPVTFPGFFSGILEEEQTEGGRIDTRRRIRGAGVSLRRGRRTARPEGQGELAYYVYSDDNGEFSIAGIEPGEYNIDIQYPGFPMDINSSINITIGDGPKDSDVAVEAVVDEGQIRVTQLVILGQDDPESGLVLFPNPTSEWLQIVDAEQRPDLQVQLYNTSGQKLKQLNFTNEARLNVADLPVGKYILKVVDRKGNEVISRRVLVE